MKDISASSAKEFSTEMEDLRTVACQGRGSNIAVRTSQCPSTSRARLKAIPLRRHAFRLVHGVLGAVGHQLLVHSGFKVHAQVVGEVREQDCNVGHLLGQGIAVLGGQGGQVGILRPLGVLHQLGGFEGNAGAQGPQAMELHPVRARVFRECGAL